MKVTDLNYAMEKPKIKVLNWLCKRVSDPYAFQNVIITDGMEGTGKSNLTAGDAYYMAYYLKRPLKLFFDVEKLADYSLKSQDEILIWDDAALGGLSLDSYSRVIIKLIKLLLLARKKRHTYFINIQEIFRLKEPIVSRAIALNHTYTPDGITLGKYTYYNDVQMRFLHDNWIHRKKKKYQYHSFRGSFSKSLYKIFDEEAYEGLKDEAIQSIAKQNDKKVLTSFYKDELNFVKLNTAIFMKENKMNDEYAKFLNKSPKTIEKWRLIKPKVLDAPDSQLSQKDVYNIGYIEPKNLSYLSASNKIVKSEIPLIKANTIKKKPEAYDGSD